MTKKWKLVATIFVMIFIIIMIPITIFASQSMSARVINKVVFNSKEIEGKFYYSIVGNATKSNDIGVDSSGKIKPVCLFHSFVNDENKSWTKVYDTLNTPKNVKISKETYEAMTVVVPDKGLDFSESNKDNSVDLYFVFLNTGTNKVTDDNRNIAVSFETDKTINLNSSLSYAIEKTNKNEMENEIITSEIEWTELGSAITTPNDIIVPAREGDEGEYSYIIIKYSMTLKNDEISFNEEINLKIFLKAI